MTAAAQTVKYPGILTALDGNSAVIRCEREASDAAGAYPITPSTQMGEYWAEAAAAGHVNVSGRPLIFIEPEGEHAAAAVTAGLSMTGLRAANFSSGQGIAYMHESLYAAVGKRLSYVLNMGCRAMTKATLNVHAGHDDYHCVDDTGFFQLFAKNAQHAVDLNLIAHRIAELALNPGIVAQDGFLTTHVIESLRLPERDLIADYLGRPDDVIPTPTPAQRMLYGETRRRIPLLWDVDNPLMAGIVQNQDAYMQSVAAQRPFFFDHLATLADQACAEYAALTGRRYARVMSYRSEDADYLIVGQGSMVANAEAVADYLRETRKLRVGVVDMLMFRPFPADLIGKLLQGKQGVAVLERVDQPLAADPPLMREIRATLSKCLENGRESRAPYPELAAYHEVGDMPPLYAGCYGLGSRDLQPEDLIAAVENMLPQGLGKRQYYLGIDFLHTKAATPKQVLHQQTIAQAYPHLAELALHGSENPNLMPADAITVRLHSVGGWGAITTGKNLALTLHDLLGYHIKANPKYGSEKKGQPTNYYLAAAPTPIRVNCEYHYVDVVLSPDPKVFNHTDALAGLRRGGVFIIQSELGTPEQVWGAIPAHYQKRIVEREIKLYYLDAFKIAREEATDPDLTLRMQGIAFQGAFFAAVPLMQQAGFDEERLLKAVKAQLQRKFGAKGARVVEDNLRVVKRGYDELHEVTDRPLATDKLAAIPVSAEPALPVMLKRLPQGRAAVSDVQRFWAQTGSDYARGQGGQNLADPFIALGTMPALSATFRDMSTIRFEHPQWIAENCTACGKCYTACPDTAIPGLVSDLSQVCDAVLRRLKQGGDQISLLPKAVRVMEGKLRALLNEAQESDSVRGMLEEAIAQTIGATDAAERAALSEEFRLFMAALGDFQFALTRPYYTLPEREAAGSGGLFSITIDPYTCKGCGECIEVCPDDALRAVTQTNESLARLREQWQLWLELPTTPSRYLRVDDLEAGIGALETMLLDKPVYTALASGDGACMGCGEKTVLHLFVATVHALMQPRVTEHVKYLNDLIQRLEQYIHLKLVDEIQFDDPQALAALIGQIGDGDLTLAHLAEHIERQRGGQVIDRDWLTRVIRLLATLKDLSWKYVEGMTGRGRAAMGMVNATGCTSVWGSTYPYNPYPFPWANHLFQDSASMALGVFEGHMSKMSEGFKAIRLAELELSGTYTPAEHDTYFTHFNWRQFSDEEFRLCPPVVAVGGDGAMYDIGFQNLSRAMMSGKPLKVVVADTQVYSNTGGQACTSGFYGQISDMAPYGDAHAGKEEVRKELGLIAMAHRTTYVMQSTSAYPNHLIGGFIAGLTSRRPALFNCYTPCQPEHGIGDNMSQRQAKLAVESRAYPLFHYDPDQGKTVAECLDLHGNPALHADWPAYKLNYQDGGRSQQQELPYTFADFAMSEVRFRKHFRHAPPATWHENMVPLADYLPLTEEERAEKFPYILSVDGKQQLTRLIVGEAMVRSCEDRRDFWILLRALAGADKKETPVQQIEERIRREVVEKISHSLLQLAAGESVTAEAAVPPAAAESATPATADQGGYVAPWIDTDQCTACGECIAINPDIFAYNDQEKAYIKDADGGPYRDLVSAAERCSARIIHPGLPRDRSEKGVEQWIKRAEKYNV